MENKNYEYNGWCANGFVALVLILLGKAASIALIIYGANQEAPAAGWIVAAGVLLLLFFFRYDTWFSRCAQAVALGICVDGFVSWGVEPLWYPL